MCGGEHLSKADGNMPILRNTFQPIWWLKGAHRQTMWPAFFRKLPPVRTKRERVTLSDGDFVDLEVLSPHSNHDIEKAADSNTIPTVLILPGLEGDIRSPYAVGMMVVLSGMGYRVVLMHMRGCSGEMNLLARSYHSGETDDIREVIGWVMKRYVGTRLSMIGYSLGGNMLIKYLGEEGDAAPIVGGAAVSVPYDLGKCATRINRGFSRVYQKRLVRSMQQSVMAKMKKMELPLKLELEEVFGLDTFWKFDDRVTAPLHGFRDAEHYYTACSSMQFLPEVKRPVLLVHSVDDPFLDPGAIPGEGDLPDDGVLELSDYGGHVGFIGRGKDGVGSGVGEVGYFLEQRIPAFLNEVHGTPEQAPPGTV